MQSERSLLPCPLRCRIEDLKPLVLNVTQHRRTSSLAYLDFSSSLEAHPISFPRHTKTTSTMLETYDFWTDYYLHAGMACFFLAYIMRLREQNYEQRVAQATAPRTSTSVKRSDEQIATDIKGTSSFYPHHISLTQLPAATRTYYPSFYWSPGFNVATRRESVQPQNAEWPEFPWVAAITHIEDGKIVPLIWARNEREEQPVTMALKELERRVKHGYERRNAKQYEWRYLCEEEERNPLDDFGFVVPIDERGDWFEEDRVVVPGMGKDGRN